VAEEDVIVPSEGNSALDPTKALSGLVSSSSLEEKANAVANAASKSFGDPNKFVSRPKGGDSGKSELENYWANRRAKEAEDLANGIKPRPKIIMGEGGGGGGGGSSRARSGKFGITGASARDYGTLKFKSKVFTDACSGAYTCIFPLSGYLPQVCGPFRPITVESIGGFPQSMGQESSSVGGPVNMDEF
jgi:hypothetical protein